MHLFEKTIVLDPQTVKQLQYWLTDNSDTSERLGVDATFVRTAKFEDGFELDIKCCGCDDDVAWTEAVLFYSNGQEACHTDVSDEYLGDWEIEWGGAVYRVHVMQKEYEQSTAAVQRKVCMLCDWARPEPQYLRLYCRKKQAIVDSEDSCPNWRDEWPKPDPQSTKEPDK